MDTGLSLSTDQVFDFVQEMGDIKLASQEAGVTQNISSLVLIFDAKTWSLKKRIKLFFAFMFDFVQVMGEIKLTLQGVGVTQKNLFLSLDL